MKTKILIFLIITGQACTFSQKQNSMVFDKSVNQTILYGYGTFDVFTTDEFSKWYSSEYKQYIPDTAIIEQLKPLTDSIYIDIILGTWCGDCRREVPRFQKVLEALNFDMQKVTIIGVDRKKACPEANINIGDINRVPTFIIRTHGQEIGRILERPTESLEEDLYRIISE